MSKEWYCSSCDTWYDEADKTIIYIDNPVIKDGKCCPHCYHEGEFRFLIHGPSCNILTEDQLTEVKYIQLQINSYEFHIGRLKDKVEEVTGMSYDSVVDEGYLEDIE